MNGSTKILTVSYGTFSCTLEGFDDPLGTMRDIAEYFRDLAADDRYFGAEPPTPDVEMLQNIAQKEVDRRVEARLSETGVALRQVENRTAPAAAPRPAVEEAEVEDRQEAAEPDTRDVAARVAGRVAAEAAAERAKSVTPPAPPQPLADADRGPLAFDDEYLMSDEPEDVLAVDPDARAVGDGPAETVAEKLRRIRAVVSRNVEEAAERRPFSQPPAGDAAPRDRAQTATIAAISADLSDEDGDHYDAGYEDEDPVAPSETPEDVEALEPEFTAEDFEDEPEGPSFVLDAPTEDEDEDETEAVASADEPEEPSGWAFEDDADEAAEEVEPAPASRPLRTVSLIIGNVAGRVERDRTEARAHVGADETPEDESPETASDEAPEPAPEEAQADRAPRALAPEPEGDVGRLIAETDTKLNDDDVVRRRRVISQMRAAVAATKADRLVSRHVSKEVAEEEEKSPYRRDLSQVVRPSRPNSEATSTTPRRPSGPPLVLVSSQRVDDGLSVGHAVSLTSEQEGFAQFARTVGAKDLFDLLEAAAAYTVFSEGQSSFTRPEIMKRVARVDPTIRLSREESLRSFGQLLREGTFKKLERGQFTIDRGTRFKPNGAIANG